VKRAAHNDRDSQSIDVAPRRMREVGDHDAGRDSRHSFEPVAVRQVRAPAPTCQVVAVATRILHLERETPEGAATEST
jgi:hypothetical protein